MASARGWVLQGVLAYALAACGGAEFSAADDAAGGTTVSSATGAGGDGSGSTAGASGDVGAGGANGVGGASGVGSSGASGANVAGTGGTNGGRAGTATGGTSNMPDASSDRGGAGGQPLTDASSTMDAQPSIDAPPDAPRDAPSDVNVVTKCPPVEPTAGTVCANGLECSYGTHPRPACRKLYVCSGSRFLTNPVPACPDPGNCLTEQPVAAQVGASCPTPQRDCTFSSGIYCRCLPDPAGASPTWDCYPSPTGCPVTPPNKGQVCDLSVPTCAYGTCRLGSKVTSSCALGIVRWDIACPDAGPTN